MEVIVLAAGQGKRMRSVLPKVLQPLAAKPMLGHVLDTARALEARRIVVVYGHGGEVVREALDAPDLAWARQDPPQGTGHAVQQAMPRLAAGQTVEAVALALGYASASAFIVMFKQRMGMTPAEYVASARRRK